MRARAVSLILPFAIVLALIPATLSAAPLAVDDQLLAVQGIPLVFGDQHLTLNDAPDGEVALEIVSWPEKGVLSLEVTGGATTLTYTATSTDPQDTFSYRLAGATSTSNVAEVTIRVTSRLPVAGHWQIGTCDPASADGLGWYDVPTATFTLCELNLQGEGPEDRLAACQELPAGVAGLGWMPLVGDWDDDGWDDVGLRRESDGEMIRFELSECNSNTLMTLGNAVAGRSGDLAITGHWNVLDELAFYRRSDQKFVFDATSSGTAILMPLTFGDPAWLPWPAAGDWDRDGGETVALYDQATGDFHYTNDLEPGGTLETFHPRSAGLSDPRTDLPVTGSWVPRDVTVPNTPPGADLGLFDAGTGKDFYLYFTLVDGAHTGPLHVKVRDDPAVPPK